MEKTPLDPLESGARANARQRAEAARQIPLWLVARACWKQKESAKLAPLAEKLATRAREAARRQTENNMLLAMLREQGELALARSDRAGAEAAWSRMLQLVVEPTDRLVKKPDAETEETGRSTQGRRPTAARDLDGFTWGCSKVGAFYRSHPLGFLGFFHGRSLLPPPWADEKLA